MPDFVQHWKVQPIHHYSFYCFWSKNEATNQTEGGTYIGRCIQKEGRKRKLIRLGSKKMACYVPFNNRNLDVSIFTFRPTVVYVDDLVEALKQFSVYTQTLGCVHSSIFKSIHGNMIVWYGAWIKRSDEKKQVLIDGLVSVLRNVGSMAILSEHSFLEAYTGESRDGCPAAKVLAGDIVTLSSAMFSGNDKKMMSYASLAIFKDQFMKMDGAAAGVCFNSQTTSTTVALVVWKSLQLCYTYIFNSDYRTKVLSYLDDFEVHLKYDVFRVVYVHDTRSR